MRIAPATRLLRRNHLLRPKPPGPNLLCAVGVKRHTGRHIPCCAGKTKQARDHTPNHIIRPFNLRLPVPNGPAYSCLWPMQRPHLFGQVFIRRAQNIGVKSPNRPTVLAPAKFDVPPRKDLLIIAQFQRPCGRPRTRRGLHPIRHPPQQDFYRHRWDKRPIIPFCQQMPRPRHCASILHALGLHKHSAAMFPTDTARC